MRPAYYILLDRLPVAVDVVAWGEFFRDIAKRRIGEDMVGKVRVSTVFLGLDHNPFHEGDPLLFETMIFGGPLDCATWRYASYDQAERGHQEAVTQAKIAAAKIKSIADKAGIT
jgi:hypothetical protein